ncbi:MAG: FAD-dependent oxidoreductase [Chloroflexi bacterium]|nr:FAD-dependent oxidoreductase [Chloroflexota bacterium]
MSKGADVVVAGGGAAGCCIAYLLSKAGLQVTLVEREAVGSHSSGFAFGGMTPQYGPGIPGPMLPLSLTSIDLHQRLAQELREATGIETHFRRRPTLKLSYTEEEVQASQRDIVWQRRDGLDVRWMTPDEARAIEPRIGPAVLGVHYMEPAASVDSYRYVLALVQAAEKHGATVRHGTVIGLRRQGGRVMAVALEKEEVPCDTAVLCVGPWSGAASTWLGLPVPIEPVKGQLIRVQVEGPPLACAFWWAGGYCESKAADGLVWTGATHEHVGFDEVPTPAGRAELMERLVRAFPWMAEGRIVRHTACLRPTSADGLPVLGPVPGWEGVYVATGGGAKGVLLSAVMARAVADLVLAGRTDLDIAAMSPTRFASATMPTIPGAGAQGH